MNPNARSDLSTQVLRWLLHYPLQRIGDMTIGLDANERTIARTLQQLRAQQYIEWVQPSLNTQRRHHWYYLTTAGLSHIAQAEQQDPGALAHSYGADERHLLRLLPRFPQITTLQDIVQSLVCSAPATLADAGSPAEIRWGWQRAYGATFEKRRHLLRCEVDAAVVLRRRTRESQRPTTQHTAVSAPFFTLFVYLDLGRRWPFTDRATMTRKLRNLFLYRESQERQRYRAFFPLIMIVVESARQYELWQLAALEAASQLHLATPLAGVIVNRAAEPPYGLAPSEKEGGGSVWNYNWRHLTSNASCRLQEMLIPMVAEAIPPGILTKPMHETLTKIGSPGQTTPRRSRRKTLVRGQYRERLDDVLQKFMAGVPLSPTQEQELIPLLGLHMSERYRELMLLLYTNPLLSTGEIAILSEHSARTTNRYVLTLEQWGCIEHVVPKRSATERASTTLTPANRNERQPAGSHEKRWILSIRGLRYLAASMNTAEATVMQRHPQTRDVQQPGVRQLAREWSHTTGVYSCIASFYHAVARQPGHTIAWFEAHFRCARRYRANGIWHNFRPDAILEYVVKREKATQRFHLWIEWDSGTMGNEALREKMQTYHTYIRSLEWRRRTMTGAVPLLLIIVPHRSQHNRMTRVLQEVFREPTLHVHITSQELLREDGPLAKIWTVVIPVPSEHPSRLRLLLDREEWKPTAF